MTLSWFIWTAHERKPANNEHHCLQTRYRHNRHSMHIQQLHNIARTTWNLAQSLLFVLLRFGILPNRATACCIYGFVVRYNTVCSRLCEYKRVTSVTSLFHDPWRGVWVASASAHERHGSVNIAENPLVTLGCREWDYGRLKHSRPNGRDRIEKI